MTVEKVSADSNSLNDVFCKSVNYLVLPVLNLNGNLGKKTT